MYAYVLKYYNCGYHRLEKFCHLIYMKIAILTSYNIFNNIIIVLTTFRVTARISDLGKVFEVL